MCTTLGGQGRPLYIKTRENTRNIKKLCEYYDSSFSIYPILKLWCTEYRTNSLRMQNDEPVITSIQ